ncbi:MAG: cytochrome c oxidase subunit II [Chloroflexi bacterium]|nr:cytochrome c oxidase subunit II [Chloroflexota bacterium]
MAVRYSTFVKPKGVWWRRLGRDEKLWVGLAVIWGLSMFAMISFIWPLIGRQQNSIQSYRVTPADFSARVAEFTAANQVGNLGGIPVVAPPPNSDVFLEAMTFTWRPILQLKRGERYRLLMSSRDVQHGFSLVMVPHSINFQVLPGYITGIELMPEQVGEFPIVCNEFCGLGHHMMIGRIIVTD